MSNKDEELEWWKDVDIGRTIENFITGAILFIGRYINTAYLYLRRPKGLVKRSIINSSLKLTGKQKDTRPLTYLVVSGFIFLVIVPDLIAGVAVFQELLKPISDQFNFKSEGVSLAIMAKYMLPFVVFVSLYSYSTSLVLEKFKAKHDFKILLNIHCYCVGTVALLISLNYLLSFFAFEATFSDIPEPWKYIPLVAVYVLGILIVAVCLLRYFQQLCLYVKRPWFKILFYNLTSFVIFWLMAYPTIWIIGWLINAYVGTDNISVS